MAVPTLADVTLKLASFPLSQGSLLIHGKLSVRRNPLLVVRKLFRSDRFPGVVLEKLIPGQPGPHLAVEMPSESFFAYVL